MRLIGGLWKRSKLPVPDVTGLRPTPDRVRETLFNWLGQDLGGWEVLDAFAGSGALGFEAASRGAERVLLLERDRALVRHLQTLKQRFEAQAVSVEAGEALAWMARSAKATFDLVLLDPPFAEDLSAPAATAARRLVRPDGLVYLEAGRAFDDDAVRAWGYSLHRHLRAGAVHAHLLAPYTAPARSSP